MDFLNRFLTGENTEILFFIILFLFLFNGSIFGGSCNEAGGNGMLLFFIILFLILFLNGNSEEC